MSTKPYDCELEYLESTGTQYIDTGILGGSDLIAKARVYWPYQNQTQGIAFGSLYKPQGGVSVRYMLQRHATYGGFYTDTNIAPATINVGSGWYDVQLNAPGGFVSVNRTVVSKTVASYLMSKPTMYLFARHVINEDISSDDSVDNISVAGVRISSFSLERNSALVLDLIPVLKDGAGYMYDKVSGTLFGNAGTGSFVLGPRVGPMFEPPSHVRRLEWLESTGTQWIDTGIAFGEMDVDARVNFGSVSGGTRMILACGVNDNRGFVISTAVNNNVQAWNLGIGSNNYGGTVVFNTWYDAHVVIRVSGSSLSVDGSTVVTVGSYSNFNGVSLYVFSRNNNGTADLLNPGARVSNLKIYSPSGTLVRDFVPVMEDGVGYLFDRVSGRMFGNSGTGSFVLGPMVGDPYILPSWARKVEYLESDTGNELILTGIHCSPDMAVSLKGKATNGQSSFFRSGTASENNVLFCISGSQNTTLQYRYNTRQTTGSLNLTPSIEPASVFEFSCNASGCVVNGVSYSAPSAWIRVTTIGEEIFLFDFILNGEHLGKSGTRMYYLQIWINGTPVRSFIPCRILDTGYLFDEISGKFYGNQGTGDFVLGPDVREGVVPTRLNPFGIGRRIDKIRRVEYLESTGSQYVVVPDFVLHANDVAEIDFRPTDSLAGTQAMLIGDLDNYSDNTVPTARLYAHSTGAWSYWQRGSTDYFSVRIARSNWYLDGELSTARRRGRFSWTDQDVSGFVGGSATRNIGTINANIAQPLTLLGAGNCSLYSFTVTNNGVLVHSFVPVRIGSTGYLLDRVSGRLFGNQGTGNFVVGPDVVPVEYVESDGTQYVDTGLTNVADIAATIRLAASSWSGDSTVLGVYTGTTRFYSFAIDNGLYACSFSGSWNSSFAPKITGLPTNSFIAASSDISNAGVTINANGTTRSTTRSDGWSGAGNFTIFKRGGAGQSSYAKIKLAMLEIRVSGVLVRDFQPVRVGTEGALYDRVTDTVFRSATSTPLVAGPDASRPAG